MSQPVSARTLHLLSLGCPKNRVDSEVMLATLLRDGYRVVEDPAQAEVILINSCAFIGPAKEESIQAILELARWKEEGRCRALVVAGCLTQRYADVLQNDLPEVDYFVGTGAYHRIADIVRGERDRAVVPDPSFVQDSTTPRLNSMPPYTAYLKVSEGCDNACTFCIIPKLRGPQRSRSIDDLVAEAHSLAERGVAELNLVAQDLTAWGQDLPGRPRLHELLRELAHVPVRWIRLHYAYPRDFPDALIDVLGREERIVKYLDMPLQHASDRMLRAMHRGRGKTFIRGLMKKLRERVPGLVVRTSFIVGFPGETADDFQELCDFVREQRFEHVGVFEFSREEGTPSHSMDAQVPARVKASRRRALMKIQRAISREHMRAMLGRRIEVLVEGPSEETPLLLAARHAGQAPEIDGMVYINRGVADPGDFVEVEIEQTGEYDLVGGIVGADGPAVPYAAAEPVSESAEPAGEEAAQAAKERKAPLLRVLGSSRSH